MTEQNKHRPSKVLRGIVIALFGLTVTFTLLVQLAPPAWPLVQRSMIV